MAPAGRSQQLTRRRVACALSPQAEEEDESFFVRASQQAAQDRMQQLRDGTDTLAISLSLSSPDASRDVPVESKGAELTKDGPEVVTEAGGHKEEEEKVQTPANETELPTTLTQSLSNYHFQRKLLEARLLMSNQATLANADKVPEMGSENEQARVTTPEFEIPSTDARSPPDYQFQRKLLETQLLMDKQSKVANASKVAEMGSENQRRHTITTENTQSPSGAFEEADAAHSTSDVRNENLATEALTSPGVRLSSDGKKLFEPPPSASEVNADNVNQGLLVLTRAFVALGSIVDKKG